MKKGILFWMGTLLMLSVSMISCSNDDESIDEMTDVSRGSNNSGFEEKTIPSVTTMSFISDDLTGEWSLKQYNMEEVNGSLTASFNQGNTLKLEVPDQYKSFNDDVLFSKGSGSYSYSKKEEQGMVDGMFVIQIDDDLFTYFVHGNLLYLEKDGNGCLPTTYIFQRKRTPENDIPYFFAEAEADLVNLSVNSENHCLVINSREELDVLYTDKVELPDIDFSKYTLVFGKCNYSFGNRDYIKEMSLRQTTSDGGELLLHIAQGKYGVLPNFVQTGFYWSLFPKVNIQHLKVNIQ